MSQSLSHDLVSFGRYTSALKIHEGSETAVYRARSAGTGVPVILKVTKNEYPTWRALARLRREFSVMRELDLERTPKPIALEEHGRGLMLVMADLCRRTLREILDERRLDIETALTIAISICDVLSAVHQRRIIHKDITPKNIVIDEPSLTAYLIDFGISTRLLQEMQSDGGVGGLEGTLVYIAPEQTGRMNRAVDLRTDLYSLGAVLYEMLTGAVPFPGDEALSLIHDHLTREATPPHARDSSVPVPLSDIVMTLLAKMPEERYQSDAGLRADLAECLRQWKANRRIERFPLRRFDKTTELLRPQRLYGRESDLAALEGAFERARLRGPELALVSGYSGVGKSALVQEIRKNRAHQHGYFISGKFDQISRDVPLAPVLQAFRGLILQILTEPPHTLAQWKGDLLDALGDNGRLLTNLIPELELIIGPQPEVPALAPDQAKNRFELTLQNFLDVFASPDHPLVIFLDDLQWIDSASLKLLTLLLVNPYTEHMLIIGAYRDNEVEPGHPLIVTLDAIKRAGRTITEIHLRPLEREMVLRLVADTLTTPAEEVAELADLVFEKTHGNPFFAHQFMVTLTQEGLLTFDLTAGGWRWDAAGIRAANITDNVVEFMVSRLQRLAPATQHAVTLAACIGHQFNLRSLATIAEKSVLETAGDLWEAMREGFIVPLDSDYRLLEQSSSDEPVSGVFREDFEVHYRFLHDRILQAAYSLVDPDKKQALHLALGRLLWRRGGPTVRDEDLLALIRHLNLGAAGITDPEERLDLARLNLRAGRQAKAATAYNAAADYLRAGIALLHEANWETDYDTCFALHLEGAECAYLSGDVDQAKELFSATVLRARTDLDCALVCQKHVRILIALTEHAEAIKVGGEGLLRLGFPITLEDLESQAVFMTELALLQTNLGDRRIEDLINEPELKDPRLRAILELIDSMGIAAYLISPTTFGILSFKAVNMALKHGPTDVCPFNYTTCGLVLAHMLGRVPEGLAFAKLAMELNKKYPNPAQTPRVCLCYAPCLLLEGTMRDAERYFAIALQTGMEVGDFTMLAYGCFLTAYSKLGAGDQLDDVLECADRHLAIARRIRDAHAVANLTIIRQAALSLAGRTKDRSTLSDDTFDEEAFLSRLTVPESAYLLYHHHLLKLHRHLLYGEHEAAIAAADEAEERLMYVAGTPFSTLLPFYRCILHFALPAPKTPEEAAQRAEILARQRGKLDFYAASSPKGYQHMKVLVDAEVARAAGEIERALRLYEQAIELSHEARAPHIEAMAYELAARCCMSIGVVKAASAYMKNAYRAYLHWGAVPKAEALQAEYANLLPSPDREGHRKKSTTVSTDVSNTSSMILSRTTLGSLRDAALILRAAQAIASEIDLPKVIDRLAALVLENAGAQRGALILSREGELVVAATFGEGTSSFDEGQGRPIDSYDGVARSVIHYVARTQEPVVLDNTSTLSRFSEDEYIRSGTPKSLLCLPLLHQARLSGILYLENRAVSGVFNAARVELLALLSSQAAISIENARLIASVRAANTEVKRVNERLELEVVRRTEELGDANKGLVGAKERLERELEQREQIELERTALQEQVIRAQRARLAEMSTPLIPITDEIVVMPLIGTLDRERATQVLTTALQGAQRHRARVVILDITGVRQVDTNVAGMLLDVAGALRMLGTEAVLTGIAPEIAQTLAGLDVGLTSFVTRGTLQSGMAYALQRVHGSGSSRARVERQGPRPR